MVAILLTTISSQRFLSNHGPAGRSGGTAPYTEADEPSPRNIYGESKLQGELRILGADPDALVIRTAVVYGPEENGKNFLYQAWTPRDLKIRDVMNV